MFPIMKTGMPVLSDDFQRLYCDAAVFEGFSALHPVSFARVLPFQPEDRVVDNPALLAAEAAHLANPNEATRVAVVEAFGRCGLLAKSDVMDVTSVIDFFDAEFFEFIGEVYANTGMFICALRWYREFIAGLETQRLETVLNNEGVYASVGYCLYSLGLYPEAITWSKSCIGPRQTVDTVSRALIDYEAQSLGGSLQYIERAASRTRYTAVGNFDVAQVKQVAPRLKQALDAFRPIQETYVDLVRSEAPEPGIQPEGYPFQAERDASALVRHRMNLIFALCGQADELIERGYRALGKQFLLEANLLEPKAEFIREKLKALP
jgi:tetratricopeptide (TPR) repeat protein